MISGLLFLWLYWLQMFFETADTCGENSSSACFPVMQDAAPNASCQLQLKLKRSVVFILKMEENK